MGSLLCDKHCNIFWSILENLRSLEGHQWIFFIFLFCSKVFTSCGAFSNTIGELFQNIPTLMGL
jgi:hypothetical protein